MLGTFPYIIAWALAAAAHSVSFLYISRVLVGVGHAMVTTTIYTVEIASRDMRATFSLWESVLRWVKRYVVEGAYLLLIQFIY